MSAVPASGDPAAGDPAAGDLVGDAVPVGPAAGALRAAGCELCDAARITPWHHEDDVCWVADCEVCGVPMVVWRRHGTDPPLDQLQHMLDQLAAVADGELGVGNWSVDRVMRQVPEHFHAHARDPRWWFRRFAPPRPPE